MPDESDESDESDEVVEEGDGSEEEEKNEEESEEEIPGISQDFEDVNTMPSIADVGKKTTEILNKKVKSWLIGKL